MNASDPTAPLIVGIGASAGGLAAFKTFLDNTPADSGMAFVLVQHLAPAHKSMLVELLQRETGMPVVEAEDGAEVLPNQVFVIPPNATMTIEHGRIGIERPAPARAHRRPIDTFFGSLAEDQGEHAVGIVLSGTGSDGSLGVRAVKEHGGLTLAQAEFDSQAQGGMPNSAAATGLVDYVLKVEEMPAKLAEYRQHLAIASSHKGTDGARLDAAEQLETICALLRGRVGHDFSEYKRKTLTRRIQRRMQVLQLDSVPEYIERLKAEPHQLELLFHELLINITQFFRDPESWDALQQTVLPRLFEGRGTPDTIRVWVPGCSTGEEVWSAAILLREALDGREAKPQLCIFGTDIDEGAIAIARAGRYRKPIAGLSAERLQRWFVEDGDGYAPAKALREMCRFSPHSLAKDPPFSKLDLICCRNLLIYMQPALQHRVLAKFHYGLKPGGWLFLGQAEGVGREGKLFGAIDKKHRLYRRSDQPSPALAEFMPGLPGQPGWTNERGLVPSAMRGGDERLDREARAALEAWSPAWVIIDRQHEILRFSGGGTGRYLEPSAGAASFDLLGIARKTLRPVLRVAVREAFAEGRAVVCEKVRLKTDGESRAVTLIVKPLGARGGDLAVVAFRDDGVRDSGVAQPPTSADGVAELEQELHVTKTQLNAAISELESANEEMKSANEEYQSVNEELQSSNEELETSKEEMQSINEEMQTVNAELNGKVHELDEANSDLRNLLESTQIATVFLDRDLCISNFTPGMKDLFHLREADLGRPITELAARLDAVDLKRDVEQVLRTLKVIERDVTLQDSNTSFFMRVLPYRNVRDVIDGVVVTFIDISERKRAEVERSRLAAIVESSQDAIILHSLDGVILAWNEAAERIFGYPVAEAVGQPMTMLLPADARDTLPKQVEALRRGKPTPRAEVLRLTRSGKTIDLSMLVSPVFDAKGRLTHVSTVARDISDLREKEAHQEMLLHELSHRVKNTLATVQAIAMQTLSSASGPEAFNAAFQERLAALAHDHELLAQSNWRGTALSELVSRALGPYRNSQQPQWTIGGDEIDISPNATLALGMVFHELATNAAKYGALSKPAGRVEVKWQVERDGTLRLMWTERGGPRVAKPERRGFGSRLIEEGLKYELDADVRLDYRPTGLRCTIEVPLPAIKAAAGAASSGDNRRRVDSNE